MQLRRTWSSGCVIPFLIALCNPRAEGLQTTTRRCYMRHCSYVSKECYRSSKLLLTSLAKPVRNSNSIYTETCRAMKSKYIDIAANLADDMFCGVYNGHQKHPKDIESVLRRANAAGVEKIIVVAGSLVESKAAIALCREYASTTSTQLVATVGVHPTRCDSFDSCDAATHLEELKKLAEDNRDVVLAVGEMGLDFDRTQFCSEKTQLKYFEYQLQLVESLKLPMLLHMRAASKPFCDILRRNYEKWSKVGGAVHSFTGTLEEALELLELNLFIGVNGCSLKSSENLQVIEHIPTNKLLLETDAPYCGIRPTHASFQHVKTHIDASVKPAKWEEGKQVKGRCEPVDIVQVAEVVYAIKGITEPFNTFCDRILQNTREAFPALQKGQSNVNEINERGDSAV